MAEFASEQIIAQLREVLDRECPLPADPVAERVVSWHVFRRPEHALEFSRHVMLGKGESLVGGRTRDSIGSLYWVGVRVEDLEAWGDQKAIQKKDFGDPQNPKSHML